MVKLIGYNAFGVQEYICDKEAEDINKLPEEATAGSTCFCIDTSNVYMKGTTKWNKI